MQLPWCSSKCHLEFQLREGLRGHSVSTHVEKGANWCSRGKASSPRERADFRSQIGIQSSELQLNPCLPATPTIHIPTYSQFAPLSVILGFRVQPQFLLSGKFTKTAYFLLSSGLFPGHTLSFYAMKKNEGFLEGTQSWLRTQPASFSNDLPYTQASNAWSASQSPLSRSFGLCSALPLQLPKALRRRCEDRFS